MAVKSLRMSYGAIHLSLLQRRKSKRNYCRKLKKIFKRNYIDYAMSVITARALPDVRDGLKPVHRRILYTMERAGLFSNKQFRKSAFVVGRTLSDAHPHGDTSV